ncbi:MAG: lysophospholipid acyltransferase family protein [Syntrophaceae bacterium]|nr:lysophospholipid acyltransferase family protein [Syntrophaceae bacterium]
MGVVMFKKYRYLLAAYIQNFLYYFIRAYSSTFRLRVENEKPWMTYMQNGGRILLCCWHQQFFSAIRYFKNYAVYNPALMISKSKDGEIIAKIAEKTGWHTIRGSSSRDGGSALRGMIAHLEKSGFAGHVVDGPRGPAGVVKAGVVKLAQATGAYVVPFYISADRAWYFNSWDRFMLPKPFSRVTLRYGEMLDMTSGEREEDFERQRIRLQEIMLSGLHR